MVLKSFMHREYWQNQYETKQNWHDNEKGQVVLSYDHDALTK